jgi:hypothetical protein
MYFSGILRFLFLFCVSISLGTAVANTASFSNYVKITVPDSFEISEDATIRKLQWFANYRFCAVPQNQDYIQGPDGFVSCNTAAYAQDLVIVGLPGIILAGITLIACIFYTSCAYCPCCACCECCTCCLGCARKPGEPHKKISMLALHILTFITLAVAIVGFVLVMVGNVQTTSAVSSITSTIGSAVNTYAAQINTIVQNAANLSSYLNNISQVLIDLQNSVNDYKTRTDSTDAEIEQLDAARQSAIFISSLIVIILMILGIVFSCCKIRIALVTVTIFCFLALFVLWISLSLHIMVTELTSDVCAEINRVQQTQNGTGELGYLIKCRNNDYSSLLLLYELEIGMSSLVNATCSAFNQTCNGGSSCTGAQQPCNQTTLLTYPSTVNITDTTYLCTVNGTWEHVDSASQCDNSSAAIPTSHEVLFGDCPQQCNNTLLRNETGIVMDNIAVLQTFVSLIAIVDAEAHCSFVLQTFLSIKELLCVTFIDAFQLIAGGTALMAIAMSGTVILLTCAFMGIP